jgi:four helix bundle protein
LLLTAIIHKESTIKNKSFAFALEVIRLYKYLIREKKEYVLSKQLLRSGTSIGANVHEALSAESKRDFIHKLGIALKESKEVSYWLKLLFESDYINWEDFQRLEHQCLELSKILSSIILTTKKRYLTKNS